MSMSFTGTAQGGGDGWGECACRARGGRIMRRDLVHVVHRGRAGGVESGASALAGPGFWLDNNKQESFNKNVSWFSKK